MLNLTVNDFYRFITAKLREGGIEDAEFEARELCCRWLGIEREDFLLKRCFDLSRFGIDPQTGGTAQFEHELALRLSGTPLQYILGEWEFYGLTLSVGEGVLCPRPETELLVELALKYASHGTKLLDLCSGTGCIPIAASLNSGCEAWAVELYKPAYAYLLANVRQCGAARVHPLNADATDPQTLSEMRFDIITMNPPYLTAADMTELQPEVQCEPQTALFGGNDGLDFYRKLLPLWYKRLRSGGIIAAEIGQGQEKAVGALLEAEGTTAGYIDDLNGITRIVWAQKA